MCAILTRVLIIVRIIIMSKKLDEASWVKLTQEQTPENLKVDKGGRRAWGYKRFKLSHLMTFANRQNSTVTVHAPYVYLEKKVEPDLPTSIKGMNEDEEEEAEEEIESDEDEWKIPEIKIKPKSRLNINSTVLGSLKVCHFCCLAGMGKFSLFYL